MGGGGGNKQSTPKVAGVSLLSNNVAQLLDVISEGEIVGAVNGLQSVYFNETPLQNSDGSYNFQGATFDFRTGTPTQNTMNGFVGLETFVSVNAKVENGTPIVRSITDPEADYVRVKIATPQLQEQTANGDIVNARVDFNIEIAEANGVFRPYQQTESAWEPVLANNDGSFTTTTGVVAYRVVLVAEGFATTSPIYNNSRNVTVSHTNLANNVTTNRTLTVAPGQYAVVNTQNGLLGGRLNIPTNFTLPQPSTHYLYYTVNDQTNVASGRYRINVSSGWTAVRVEQLRNRPLSFIGRATSAYEREYVMSLPKGVGSPWTIRVTRLTPNSTSQQLQNDLFFSSFVIGTEAKLAYQNTAIAGVTVDASLFGNNIPTRGYLIDGVKIKIPSNYNPITRVYDESGGYWNGTFTTAWSNNPAWVLYDVLTNARYGGGQHIDPQLIDKFDFYEAGKYCDELVGVAGTNAREPRYTFNYWFANGEAFYDIVAKIANTFNANVYVSNGIVRLTLDQPKPMTHVFSPSNVISNNGVTFSYATPASDQINSVVQVTYNDPKDMYKPKIVTVEDSELIDIYGFQTESLTGFGITSEGQARRLATWVLDTNKNQKQTVTFSTGLEGADVMLGDVIGVCDPLFQVLRLSGRIVAYIADIGGTGFQAIRIDAPITTQVGKTYEAYVHMNDGSLRTRTVLPCDSNGVVTYGNATYFRFTTPITTATGDENDTTAGNSVSPNNVWAVSSFDNTPREFYVIGKNELVGDERFQYSITAIEYDRSKYARIDASVVASSTVISAPSPAIQIHSNIRGFATFTKELGVTIRTLFVGWQPSLDTRVKRYAVYYRSNSNDTYVFVGYTQQGEIALGNLPLNVYDVRVDAETFSGAGFTTVGSLVKTVDFSEGNTPPDTVHRFSYAINGNNLELKWEANTEEDLLEYELRFTPVKTGTNWEGTPLLVTLPATSTTYLTTFQDGTYYIKAKDYYGVYSVSASSQVTFKQPTNNINVVEVITEHPTFAGTKSDLSTVGLGADTMLTLTDPTNHPEGYYLFSQQIDLGAVYVSRLTSNVTFKLGDLASWVAFMPNIGLEPTMATVDTTGIAGIQNMSQVENVGLIGQFNYVEGMVELQVALSQDGVSFGDYETFRAGDYEAQAFRFKLFIRALDGLAIPLVDKLSVTCDMPDRLVSAEAVTLASGWNAIAYTPAFKAVPNLQVTPTNLEANEHVEIRNETASGAEVRIVHGNGSSPSGRIVNWLATGYGVVV